MFNEPPQHTPFVGRQAELQELIENILDPQRRLLTMVGQGGSGKTRLALEVLRMVNELNEFEDGVFFISLQAVHTEEEIITAITDVLGLRLQGQEEPRQQLIDALSTKETLMLLDNFEHLLAAADIISDMLAAAPALKVLVTSREVLNLQEEWNIPLTGLRFPDIAFDRGESNALADESSYDAIQLFAQRAQRVRRDFSLSDQFEHVVRICHLVDGMPLALELAAAWHKILPISEIASEIEHSLDILTAQHRNMPERHRSMRAVLEQSWRLLTRDEQAALMRLSVFRNGFRRDAASQIAHASLLDLASLLDKSLLHWEEERYHLHELTRQFASEQLIQSDEAEAVNQRHMSYYLSLLADNEDALHGSTVHEAMTELRQELDNIRKAWRTAVTANDLVLLREVCGVMAFFYELTGLIPEGYQLFHAAGVELEKGYLDETETILAILLHSHSLYFASYLEQHQSHTQQKERAIALAADCNDPFSHGILAYSLAYRPFLRGDYEPTQEYLQQALPLLEAHGKWHHVAACLQMAGEIYGRLRQHDEAQVMLERSLELCMQHNDIRGRALTLSHMGVHSFFDNAYQRAATYTSEAVTFFEQAGDLWRASKTMNNLSFILFHLEKYDEALEAGMQALVWIKDSINDADVGNLYDTLGHIYFALGQYEESKTYFQKSFDETRLYRQLLFECEQMINLAAVDIAQHQYAAAAHRLDQALAMINDETPADLAAKAHGTLGLLYGYTERQEQALDEFDQAVRLLETIDERFERASFLTHQGALLLAMKRREEANAALSQAISLATPLDRRQLIQRAEELQQGGANPFTAAANRSARATKGSTVNQDLVEPLTERESEVLQLMSVGHTNKEIADELILSVGTVKWYTGQIYGKLGVKNRTQAMVEARRLGYVATSDDSFVPHQS